MGEFNRCTSLRGVFFRGNAPIAGSYVFDSADQAVVYYPSGTTGWSGTRGDRPARHWNPTVLPGSVRVTETGFRFTVIGTPNILIVVEAWNGRS